MFSFRPEFFSGCTCALTNLQTAILNPAFPNEVTLLTALGKLPGITPGNHGRDVLSPGGGPC